MIEKMLLFNPEHRLSAVQAMDHPYVAKFHDPANEPTLDKAVAIPIVSERASPHPAATKPDTVFSCLLCFFRLPCSQDDNTKFSIADYRDKLYGDVVRKRGAGRRGGGRGAPGLANAEKTRARRASAGGSGGGAAAGGTR